MLPKQGHSGSYLLLDLLGELVYQKLKTSGIRLLLMERVAFSGLCLFQLLVVCWMHLLH